MKLSLDNKLVFLRCNCQNWSYLKFKALPNFIEKVWRFFLTNHLRPHAAQIYCFCKTFCSTFVKEIIFEVICNVSHLNKSFAFKSICVLLSKMAFVRKWAIVLYIFLWQFKEIIWAIIDFKLLKISHLICNKLLP